MKTKVIPLVLHSRVEPIKEIAICNHLGSACRINKIQSSPDGFSGNANCPFSSALNSGIFV